MFATSLISEFLIHAGNSFFGNNQDRFIDDFKKNVLVVRNECTDSHKAGNYYRMLLGNNDPLTSDSPGAGTRSGIKKLTVSHYVRRTSVNRARASLLSAIVRKYKPELIIELGTAFGISTQCMAVANPLSRIITVEGNPEVAEMTSDYFKSKGFNITVINSCFDDVVPDLARSVNEKSMIFIDGNHRFNATIDYYNAFNQAGILVFDDIRWSQEMISAWRHIKKNAVSSTIVDLFDVGIIFGGGSGKVYYLWI